jgi:outer membrane cobalamin receptor
MDVSFEMIKYKMGSAFSIYAVSNRFSLNENNKANWVNGFGIMDLMLFKTISFNENQSLRISISVKNLANSTYEYIRYFVMPGRNYMLRLSYGF